MMRVLVAVDDSAPALAAATLAIRLARTQPCEINFVTVAEPGKDSKPILDHVAALAVSAAVDAIVNIVDDGQPFEALLAAADHWHADVIIIGRSDVRRPGQPYVGSQTEHLLEFTTIPVLVVPEPQPNQRPRVDETRQYS